MNIVLFLFISKYNYIYAFIERNDEKLEFDKGVRT
jgi:hypothetical protein